MEKNKDKSHLIDQLYDYLEEQIQELKTDRNQLNHKMQDMIQEKNEKRRCDQIISRRSIRSERYFLRFHWRLRRRNSLFLKR